MRDLVIKRSLFIADHFILMRKYLLIMFALLPLASPTLYSLSADYKVTYQLAHTQLAHALYDVKANEQGWNYLSILTSSQHSLLDQHRAAGFLQGYITYRDIYSAFANLQKSLLGTPNLGSAIQNYIDVQIDYIDALSEQFSHELFWSYVKAYMEQIRYMHRGYLMRLQEEGRADLYLGFSQLYYLTLVGDLEDLLPAFGNTLPSEHRNCNGYVKLQNGELLIGHSTHNIYPFLLRVFKTYHFPSQNEKVGSQRMTFSSRPGDLISKDDFYVLSSGLKVFETSLNNYNQENYKLLNPKSLPSWLRVCVAMNLARSGSEWVDYFLKFSSGTHNNQWMVIDASKLKAGKEVVTLLEEGFDEFSVLDMTPRLLQKGFVASYNIPVTLRIVKKLGYDRSPEDYDHNLRAQLFTKYNPLMVDQESMKKWLMTNEEDNPRDGLAPRYDLYEADPQAFGLTDCKIITPKTERQNFIWAISGPTTSNGRFAPFNFTQWPQVAQEGIPKLFNFQWQQARIDQELMAHLQSQQ